MNSPTRGATCRPASMRADEGGYVVAPYAVLADGRCYKSAPGAPDLIAAFKAGSIPHVPQGVVDLIQARKQKGSKADSGPATGTSGIREKQLRARRAGRLQRRAGRSSARPTQRDAECLAYRLGRMVARGWIERAEVEAALTEAIVGKRLHRGRRCGCGRCNAAIRHRCRHEKPA